MRRMKDSGVEWIGEIPENWKVIKAKYSISLNDSGVWGSDPNGGIHDKIVIRSTEQTIDGKWTIIDPAKRSLENVKYENSRILKDDLLMTKSSGSVLHIGKTTIADDYFDNNECYFSNFIQRIRVKDVNPKLIWYMFNSSIAREQFIYLQNSTSGIGNINGDNINNIYIPLGTKDEQNKIVNYLDEKCAKIDAIIEKQQSVIEKLKEYKLSVITETITKGLDKTVDMKVLDREWVDNIPTHWKWMSLKSVTEFITCGVAATPEYTDKESGALFLSAQNVKQGVMDYSIERYITKELHESLTKKRKPKRGDLLQVRVGASIGNVAVVDTDEEFSVYVSLTHLRCNEMIKNEFLKFCMMSPLWLQKAFSYVDFAGSQGNLNVADLRILKVPVPPINEQIDIMNYLKIKTNMIDYNIHQKEEISNRLQEYKKSLIYEVVTGKKEV